jgi:hypothetical protein
MSKTEYTANACRHFKGLVPSSRKSCAKGWDIRKWATKCNGDSPIGIGLRLPCTRQKADSNPLFDCPSLDRKTDEEVAAQRKEMDEHMTKFVAGLGKMEGMRQKMIAKSLSSAVATCPWCGEKDALRVSCAIGANNHMKAKCTSCEMGFIE